MVAQTNSFYMMFDEEKAKFASLILLLNEKKYGKYFNIYTKWFLREKELVCRPQLVPSGKKGGVRGSEMLICTTQDFPELLNQRSATLHSDLTAIHHSSFQLLIHSIEGILPQEILKLNLSIIIP